MGKAKFGLKKHVTEREIEQNKKITADNLLGLIGLSLIDDIAQELQSDKWVIKLKSGVIIKLTLYSLLEVKRIKKPCSNNRSARLSY